MVEQMFDTNADIKEPARRLSYGEYLTDRLGRLLYLRTEMPRYTTMNGLSTDWIREILDNNSILDQYRDIQAVGSKKYIAEAKQGLKVLEKVLTEK